jgi:alpha-L-fucosidase
MSIPIPTKRIADFEELGFGIFVHWGLYSQIAQAEWIQHLAPGGHIPASEYSKHQKTFTASKFDARALVRMAKDAGAKYMVLTTKHHEGFALYDACGLNEFDAPHSPAGRDLVREFVDACNEEGISPFFYHATYDWYIDEFETDFPKYLKYLRDCVEILCTKYGKIGGFWFDGNWSKSDADWEEDALYSLIRKHQPDAIIVNNTGIHARGDFGHPEIDSVTFENGRAEPLDREGHKKYVAGEMCETMNAHWGYANRDLSYKSLSYFIETLCNCRKVGANYLLNIGPDGEGEVPMMQKAMLAGIGDWIRLTGDGFYKAKPCGIVGGGKDFALRNGNKLYFYVHDLPNNGDGNVTLANGDAAANVYENVKWKVKNIRWTDTDRELDFTQDGDKLTVNYTGYQYGINFVVRVAEAEIEE